LYLLLYHIFVSILNNVNGIVSIKLCKTIHTDIRDSVYYHLGGERCTIVMMGR
jgi:hypothetical protein